MDDGAPEGGSGILVRRRYLPAALSALVPGLGHLVTGRRRLAALFALPIVVLLVAAVLVAVLGNPYRLLAELVDPTVLWSLLVLQVLVLVWRLAAVGSTILDPRLPRPRVRDAIPIGLVLALVLVPQLYAGYAWNVARETADQIFVSSANTSGAWNPSASLAPGATPEPTAEPDPSAFLPAESPSPNASSSPSADPSPSPSESAGPARLNVLMIGVDAGVGRRTYLTDTLIVASLDPVAETVSMVSIPRDLVDVPLPDGRRFRGKINSLLAYARQHPRAFPGSDGTGHDVLMGALSTLLGLRIDYYAKVNLGGFVRVVNKLGGIDVVVRRSFCDPLYDEYGFTRGFSIRAGRRHLNGNQALAYARVRKAAGESDFSRAARQQEVLSGIRDAMVRGGFLRDPIGLLRALGGTIETNVPRSMLPDLADVMRRVDRSRTFRAVVPAATLQRGMDRRGYILIPNLAALRTFAARLFTQPGTVPAKVFMAPAAPLTRAANSGVGSCAPAAAPRATPRPTPRPTTGTATAAPTSAPTAPPSP